MNSHERVMTAMRLGQPDRVPIVEWVIHPKVRRAICPGPDLSFVEVAECLGLDNLDCGVTFQRIDETEDGWIDEWGVRYVHGAEVLDHPVEGPIHTFEDLRSYQPPDPDAPHRLGALPELARRYKGERALILRHRAAFMWSAFLMGLDNLLMAFAAEPRLAMAVMDMVVEVNERIARNAVRAGAAIVVLADDYAANWGPMFSPEHFRQLVQPRLRRMVDAIHEEGGLVIKHSDGNLWPILDQIVDTGVDALNPIEPVANMDIAKVKAAYGDRLCLVGNIDCGHLLCHGTPREVEAAVRRCIADAGEGGGFMLASSNSIHSSVDPANYVAMVEAGHRWGKYEQ